MIAAKFNKQGRDLLHNQILLTMENAESLYQIDFSIN